MATALLFEVVGTAEVACEAYGYERFERALAVCSRGERDLNRELVWHGWALGWYLERGAVFGPDDADAEAEARSPAAGWGGASSSSRGYGGATGRD